MINDNFNALFSHSEIIKMKYIGFESWVTTWLHEGNIIVEDQLTHNFMPKPDRTTQGRILRRSAKCEQKLELILF